MGQKGKMRGGFLNILADTGMRPVHRYASGVRGQAKRCPSRERMPSGDWAGITMDIMFLQILQHAVREYDAKLDIKRRMSLRSGHFEYDHVSEYVDHF